MRDGFPFCGVVCRTELFSLGLCAGGGGTSREMPRVTERVETDPVVGADGLTAGGGFASGAEAQVRAWVAALVRHQDIEAQATLEACFSAGSGNCRDGPVLVGATGGAGCCGIMADSQIEVQLMGQLLDFPGLRRGGLQSEVCGMSPSAARVVRVALQKTMARFRSAGG